MTVSVFCAILLLACAVQSSVAQSSCSGRCGEEYYRGFTCHCDYECVVHDECCKDYLAQCTTKGSCKGRCGEGYKRGRGCTCDADCQQFNQCCPDFKNNCDPEESSKGPASPPAKTSTCDNVNDNKPTDSLSQPEETPVNSNVEEDQDLPESEFSPLAPESPQDPYDDVTGETYPNIPTDTSLEVPPIPEASSGYEPSLSDLLEPSLTLTTPYVDSQDDPEQEATAEETYTTLPGDQEGDTGPTDGSPTQTVPGAEADSPSDLEGQADSSPSPPTSEPTLPGSPSAQPSSEPQTAPSPAESGPDAQPDGQAEPQPETQDVDHEPPTNGTESPVPDPESPVDLITTTASPPTSPGPTKNPPSPDDSEPTPASPDSTTPSTNPLVPEPTTPSTNPLVPEPTTPSTNPLVPEPTTPSTNPLVPEPTTPSTNPLVPEPTTLASEQDASNDAQTATTVSPSEPQVSKGTSSTPVSEDDPEPKPSSETEGDTPDISDPKDQDESMTTPATSVKEGDVEKTSTDSMKLTPTTGKPTPTPAKPTQTPAKPTQTPAKPTPTPVKPTPAKPASAKPASAKPTSKPKPKPTKPSSVLAQALGTYNPRDFQSDDNNNTNLCTGRPAGATTTLRNGTVVVFRGHYFWTLDSLRNPGPARGITDVWGVPSPIDTVFTRCNCQGKTYILRGPQYWRFDNGMVDQGYPKMVSTGFDGLQGQITAALSVPEYRRRGEAVYFFKSGGLVQRYSYKQGTSPTCGKKKVHYAVYTARNRVARQAASPLGAAINIRVTWKGFPSTVTSAVSIPDRRVAEGYSYYVFSRSKYYNVKMEDRPVLATPMSISPKKNSAKDFFNCPKTV